MNWATFLFRDLVQERLDGGNPFGNIGAVYSGSRDDAALNAARAALPRPTRRRWRKLAADSDPTGRVNVPTLEPACHRRSDGLRRTRIGLPRRCASAPARPDLLVQTFSRESEHSYLSDAEYPTLFAALLDWIDHGRKPTPADIAARCKDFEAALRPGLPLRSGLRAAAAVGARAAARQRP